MKNIIEIEIEQPETGRLMHMLFDIENVILYQEVECLPEDIILCAVFDGVICKQGLVGETDQQVEKRFIPVDWLLQNLDSECRAALQIRKDHEISQLEYYREKFKEVQNHE